MKAEKKKQSRVVYEDEVCVRVFDLKKPKLQKAMQDSGMRAPDVCVSLP
jgi:hypothetical protein